MSPTYATPLRLEIKSSKQYLIFSVVVTLIAIFSLSFLLINVWLKCLLVLAIGLFSLSVYLNNQKIVTIIWKQQNEWEIRAENNVSVASLLPNSLVLPWLTILNFKLLTGEFKSILIFSDNLDKEIFRQLRVRLKVTSGKLFSTEN